MLSASSIVAARRSGIDAAQQSGRWRNLLRACGAAAALFAAGAASAQTVTWTKIADEFRSFSVSGTQVVRYGSSSTWIEKSVTGSGQCTNSFFGRDPLPGITKQCQLKTVTTTSAPAASTPAAATPTGWTKIANEYQSFTVSGTQRVRYGQNSSYVEKDVTGSGQCTNGFFGSDPLMGVTKQCEVATQTTTPPAATPPVIASFSVAPGSVTAGGSVVLSWSVTDAATLSIDNGIGTVTGMSRTVTPAQTTTYTLTATNTAGTVTRTTTVVVNDPLPPQPTSASRAVPNNRPVTWKFCSQQYNGGCTFDGMHQVRFGDGTKWVVKKVLHQLNGFECASGFFESDPAPGKSKYCEVANEREEGTIAVPGTCYSEADGCTPIDLSRIPLGSAGYSELRIKPADDAPIPTTDGGAFRTLCEYSHMAFDDPIVYPNQPGKSHLHVFFGNTGTDAFSTRESIAGTGNSTCSGGIANRTAYWIPALVDIRTGTPIVPDFTIWYYKTFVVPAYPISQNEALPSGLRMIAGDMHATGPQNMTGWNCFGRGGTDSASVPTNCEVGDYVQMHVVFPTCWDGKNLDSADHKSHMSYSLGAEGCPDSHKHPVPQITLNVRYLLRNKEDAKYWRLSSDHTGQQSGISAHADWFDGWMPSVRDTWVKNCEQRTQNCEADLLGDGNRLY